MPNFVSKNSVCKRRHMPLSLSQVSCGAQLFSKFLTGPNCSPSFFFAGSKSSQSFLRGPLISQASCGPTFTLSFLRGPLYPKFIAGPILPKVSCGARLFPNFLAGPNCSLIFLRGPLLPQVSCGAHFTPSLLRDPFYPKFLAVPTCSPSFLRGPIVPQASCGAHFFRQLRRHNNSYNQNFPPSPLSKLATLNLMELRRRIPHLCHPA